MNSELADKQKLRAKVLLNNNTRNLNIFFENNCKKPTQVLKCLKEAAI